MFLRLKKNPENSSEFTFCIYLRKLKMLKQLKGNVITELFMWFRKILRNKILGILGRFFPLCSNIYIWYIKKIKCIYHFFLMAKSWEGWRVGVFIDISDSNGTYYYWFVACKCIHIFADILFKCKLHRKKRDYLLSKIYILNNFLIYTVKLQ